MYIQETIIAYSLKLIIIYIITFLIIYTIIIKINYKNNSCRLNYLWEKLQFNNIKKELTRIKNILKNII